MSELLLLGVSHKTAPVAIRERLALSENAARDLCRALVDAGEAHEAVAISTCNRTEVYLVAPNTARAHADLLARLAATAAIDLAELEAIVYAPRNCDAARHLYRVCSGLDSMIPGEAEVQGQVRRSHEAALSAGTTGPLTNRLFAAALQTGKRVRTETGLGASRTSIASVAVALARETVGELAGSEVVVIGAGETSELTARALAQHGVRTLFVANRHAARARALAKRVGGRVSSLDDLPERIVEADVVVASTASPHPIIGAEELRGVMAARGGRPLVLIDIAVPRDVEHACADIDGVALYDIDDLEAVIERNLSLRDDERAAAEEIVEEEIRRFAVWMGQLEVLPTIAELREFGAAIVDQVLGENAGRWETASARDRARVDAIARAVMQRLLHEPTIRLKTVERGSSHGRLQIIRELFGLGEDDVGAVDVAESADGAEVRPLPRRSTGP